MKQFFLLILILGLSQLFCAQSNKFTQKKCYEDSVDEQGYIVSDCGRKRGIVNFDEKLMIEPGTNIILWSHNVQPFSGECESCFTINEKTNFRFKVENGNINGNYFVNYPSGCIQERGVKIMGKFDGLIELFYDSTSAPKEIANYVLGKLDGPQLFLKPNGDTIAFENYKVLAKGDKIESILDGVQRLYYSNGKMESEVYYKSGELDGSYRKYNKEGILINDRNFKKGKESGRCISYYDDGKMMYEENWKDGIKDGAFVFYLPNDSIKFKEYYKKGQPEGTFLEYFDNRQMKSRVQYLKGIKIKEEYWNEYGQDITDQIKKEEAEKNINVDSKSPKNKNQDNNSDTNLKKEKKEKDSKSKKQNNSQKEKIEEEL